MVIDSAPLGVTRNLSEVFNLLRSNAQQSKFIYANSSVGGRTTDVTDERMSLLSLEEGGEHLDETCGPLWIHTSDEVEFEFGRIRSRLEELALAQQKHVSRPNFGDDAFEAEEKQMEAMTDQITSMMSHSQRLITMMSAQAGDNENRAQKKLRENTVSAMIFTLSELTNDFRTRQAKYLNNIKKRNRDVDDFLITTGTTDDVNWGELVDVTPSQEYTMDQIQQIMLNDQEVKEREKEVLAVNSSIRDLNTLFKDLSSMVIDQGTILDRIDYNVEQASMRVSRAVDSVRQAERHQRGDKKMHCICCLAVAIVFVLLLIVFTKF